ncbi:ROK family transcriptional regulator [Conservatibacter flavescens]|uniref:ROK family protein n=1 Tax=Conservatibacter flavescens TaxID=28161 RepID=A0A2M8S2V5_9PAST|nr:ROK family transcriptional regulator [Conservatibacter flavescens]PJG85483.1 ROK family protein [Conservatibacter flavescens]
MVNTVKAQHIKQNNYNSIYQLFFSYSQLSKPQIANLLGLSLPTVLNNMAELERENKIKENGVLVSQGGRPATAYQLVNDAFIAIGVEIQQKRIKLVALDLNANPIKLEKKTLQYQHTQTYLEELSQMINTFIEALGYEKMQILGIGISVQGIVGRDSKSLLYSKILNFEHFNIETLQCMLDYPIHLFHDVKCAARMELWKNQDLDNAFYLSISEHLGGAFILNNQIEKGKNSFSGALEHLQIHHDGKSCYCGQRGCLEAYCSLSALLHDNEKLSDFFSKLRQSDPQTTERWQQFLRYLAKGLNAVYLIIERDIVLGGDIARYLCREDIVYLEQEVRKLYPFPLQDNFIKIANLRDNVTVQGAALPFIANYLAQLQ